MPKARVTAARFSSLLANRRKSVHDVQAEVTTQVALDDLAARDLDLEFEDLVALAKYFKKPWSYLLINEAEHLPGAGDDHRTVANQRIGFSVDLLAELQAADDMLSAALELFPDGRSQVPAGLSGSPTPRELAATMRAFLDVSGDAQLAVADDYGALRLWIAAIHARGVYVSQRRLPDESIKAFSKTRSWQSVIVVDTGDTPYARIFSALHEYAHLTLRSAGVCDLDDHSAVERYCNAVAAATLVPDELLAGRVSAAVFTGNEDVADEALKQLSRQLHASQATILIALRERSVITQDTYDAMELRRRSRGGARTGTPGGQYYRTAINRVGRLFARRVVGAFTEGFIDRQDTSALLGVGEHNVERYVRELAQSD